MIDLHVVDAASPAVPAPVGFRAVLVPLDGSPHAERALEPARWLAGAFGAELHATFVARHREEHEGGYLDAVARRERGLITHRLDGRHPGTLISRTATELDPALICMTTHGRSRSAAVLGSVFTTVANVHPAPLVAVGPRALFCAARPAPHILACIDGSPGSEQVLPVAAGWARQLGFRLTIARVVEPAPPPVVPERRHHHPDLDPGATVERLVQRWSATGLDVTGLVIPDPIGTAGGVAEHVGQHPAAFVAVASHVRTGLSRATHGSQAARIIHRCPVPVLVEPVDGQVPHN